MADRFPRNLTTPPPPPPHSLTTPQHPMSRLALAAGFALLAFAATARAADLPIGEWSVVVNGTKGSLYVKEVGRDGKVNAALLGGDIEGTWDGTTLTFQRGSFKMEAFLVAEEEKGQTKYTLTGTRVERIVSTFVSPPLPAQEVKSGWYAQKVVKEQGRIKADVKGTLVCKDTTGAYVSVKRDDGFGKETETRVYFWLSEGEWKYWRDVLPKLDGQEVTVSGALDQIPKDSQTSIPEGAMYFLRGFTIKTATETFK